MPNFTPELDLIKPFGTENFSVQHANGNADKIDSAFGNISASLKKTEDRTNSVEINVKYPPPPLSPVNGDGIEDNTSGLNSIFAYLSATGGNVFLPDKNYKISGKLIVPQNTKVSGSGIDLTTIEWDESNSSVNWMIEFTPNSSDKKSFLSDLTLNQKRRERNLLDSQSFGAIHAGDNLSIERVRILNTVGPGITQGAIQNFSIYNSEVFDTGHHGIYFSSGSGEEVKNIEIISNYIGTPSTFTGRLLGAHLIKLRFDDASDIIENITIRDNTMGSGMLAEGFNVSTTTGGDCLLKKLTFENNQMNAGRDIVSGMTSAIYVGANSKGEGISIAKNKIFGSGTSNSYGIRLLFSNANLTNNVAIKDNYIENVARGIDARKTLIADNFISFSVFGILCINGKASKNALISSYDSAIGIEQSTIDMIENEITLDGLTGIGINMANSQNLVVKSNKIYNANIGISRNSKSLNSCTLDDNKFINCSQNYSGFLDNVNFIRNNIFEPSVKSRHGTTSNRPAALYVGENYFDTTLNKLISWNGTSWVDGTGATV